MDVLKERKGGKVNCYQPLITPLQHGHGILLLKMHPFISILSHIKLMEIVQVYKGNSGVYGPAM